VLEETNKKQKQNDLLFDIALESRRKKKLSFHHRDDLMPYRSPVPPQASALCGLFPASGL